MDSHIRFMEQAFNKPFLIWNTNALQQEKLND